MQKHIRVAIGVAIVLVLILTATISYRLGEKRMAEVILHSDIPSVNKESSASSVDEAERASSRDRFNRLANDYESACYNYQALYAAYDALYKEAGANSGHEKLALPDGARGNEESCYR
jgi:hypothetical protein